MSWYVHPSRQLRDDELPPELVVTNRDGSIEQVYVPYDATGEQLKAENDNLRELVRYMHRCYVRGHDWGPYGAPEREWVEEQMRELGIEVER